MLTPNGNRLHIGIYGSCNSGKSSLINKIVGQDVAMVSDTAGTTTDPVYKAMEIKGLGAVTLIDTAGYDDTSTLGALRIKATESALIKTDIAILVFNATIKNVDRQWIARFKELDLPYILVNNTRGVSGEGLDGTIVVNAISGVGVDKLVLSILKLAEKITAEQNGITDGYVKAGSSVMLVMPQDGSAPQGRLILPQVQVIRELLDKQCIVTCLPVEKYAQAIALIKADLIITDSQVFDEVYNLTPKEIPLTSFSVMFAGQKGDMEEFLRGAHALMKLPPTAKILIAEACAHAPQNEDIGRVKIPAMLGKKLGISDITVVAGNDFPQDLSGYDMIIHCGACMFNRRHVLNRIISARRGRVYITNYGLAIAALNGILDKITVKK